MAHIARRAMRKAEVFDTRNGATVFITREFIAQFVCKHSHYRDYDIL